MGNVRGQVPIALVGGLMLTVLASGAVRVDDVAAASLAPDASHASVCASEAAAGDELHHAGVILVFPEGTDTYCIAFEEEQLSGAELLQRTGLTLVFSGFGGLGAGVCRIDGVGCSDPGDCWCQCRGADCHYWTYYEFDGGSWRFLPIGASQRRVHDGDVDAWVWGNGRTPPDASATGALCSELQPGPLPTATPRATGAIIPTTVVQAPSQPGASTPAQERSGVDLPPTAPERQTSTPSRGSEGVEPTSTPVPHVVRQSNRPTTAVSETEGASSGSSNGSVPFGLVSFGAVASGIVVVAAGIVARRRIRGN